MSQPAPLRPVSIVAERPTAVSSPGKPSVSPRLFQVAQATWWAACGVVPLCVLLDPVVGGAIFVPIVLCGLLVFPGSGVVLLAGVLTRRDRAHTQAFLGAALGAVLCVAVLGPAARMGVELSFGSRQAALDRLAAEVGVAFAAADAHPRPPETSGERVNDAFRQRLGAVGLMRVSRGPEGLLFTYGGLESGSLLYAGAGADPSAPACLDPRPRLLGGRWYHWRCLRMARERPQLTRR
jgi:hypothetical protein